MKIIILSFVVWLTLLLGVGLYSETLPKNPVGKCTVKNELPYYRWDSFWYTSITRHGYFFSTEKNSSIAFFPLYPLVIRGLHFTTGFHEDILSFAFNILSALLFVFCLYKLARLDFSEDVSVGIVLVCLFFPPAYFFLSGYPEALFVLLAVTSLYCARKKRWVLAGITAALLAITKPYGILLLPTLFFEYFLGYQWKVKEALQNRAWLALLLPLISLGGFMYFNYLYFGHPLAFLEAQQTWGRSLSGPLISLWKEGYFHLFSGYFLSGQNFPYVVYLVTFLLTFFAAWAALRFVRKSYLVFSFLLLLAAFLTGTLTSWDRYLLLGFPLLMGPAVFLSRYKKLFLAYLIFSAVTMLFLASLFVRCYPME